MWILLTIVILLVASACVYMYYLWENEDQKQIESDFDLVDYSQKEK